MDEFTQKEIEQAIDTLTEHTQYFCPIDDLYDLRIAITALEEYLETNFTV